MLLGLERDRERSGVKGRGVGEGGGKWESERRQKFFFNKEKSTSHLLIAFLVDLKFYKVLISIKLILTINEFMLTYVGRHRWV